MGQRQNYNVKSVKETIKATLASLGLCCPQIVTSSDYMVHVHTFARVWRYRDAPIETVESARVWRWWCVCFSERKSPRRTVRQWWGQEHSNLFRVSSTMIKKKKKVWLDLSETKKLPMSIPINRSQEYRQMLKCPKR